MSNSIQISGSVTADTLTAGASASANQIVTSAAAINMRNGAVIQFNGVTQPQLPVTASNGQFVVSNGTNYIARALQFGDVQYLVQQPGFIVSRILSGTTYTLDARNIQLADLNPLISANNGTVNQILMVNSSGQWAFQTPDYELLTTKGDLLTFGPARLPAGATGALLRANAANANGLDYVGTQVAANTIIGTSTPTNITANAMLALFGVNAGGAMTTGSANSFFGDSAGIANTTGFRNSYVGVFSGYSNVSGTENTAIGFRAGFGLTGNYNLSAGSQSLGATNNNAGLVALGYYCGNLTTGADFCAAGYNTFSKATSGSRNTGFGSRVAPAMTTAADCTIIGAVTAPNATVIDRSTIIGSIAAAALTTGTDNTVLGYNSGSALTTGSGNVCLGTIAGVAATNNTTYVANVRTSTITTGNLAVQVGPNGNLGVLSSSQRFKKNIVPMIQQATIHTRFMQLVPSTFTYKLPDQTTQYGLIAEQTATLFPELVVWDTSVDPAMQLSPADAAAAATAAATGTPMMYAIRYEQFTGILISEVQQLYTANAALTATVAALSARLDSVVGLLNKRILGGGFV